ncbi:MAG: ribbon-helix-helix domain-containing protein [Alphaproteobacteria bacterium]|nr:ribbon-helix-helix domain-containing protein [Alphaproteobacteria bacterium]
MPRATRSRNVIVDGRRTSVRLEDAFWAAADDLCQRERQTLSQLCTAIETGMMPANLTAAVRLAIIGYYRAAASETGHARAGHGGDRRPSPMPADRAAARRDKPNG